jgi:hypothetical protein
LQATDKKSTIKPSSSDSDDDNDGDGGDGDEDDYYYESDDEQPYEAKSGEKAAESDPYAGIF